MGIKFLSRRLSLAPDGCLVRSAIGVAISLLILRAEGGWRLLRTERPLLHALRAGLIVVANMTFFAALAVMPLGAATALFFLAPLFNHAAGDSGAGRAGGPAPQWPPSRSACWASGVMMAPGVDWGRYRAACEPLAAWSRRRPATRGCRC